MVKLSVMYPHKEGSKFDLDYYLNKHLDLVQAKWGGLMKDAYVTKGLGGGAPGHPPTYQIMAHLTFESVDDLNNALTAHGSEVMADIPNFTDITPVVQVSEMIS